MKITGSKIKLLIHGYYFYLTETRRKQYFDHITGKRLPFAFGRLGQNRRNQCLIGRTYENHSLIFRTHTFLNCWPAEAGAGCLSRPVCRIIEGICLLRICLCAMYSVALPPWYLDTKRSIESQILVIIHAYNL